MTTPDNLLQPRLMPLDPYIPADQQVPVPDGFTASQEATGGIIQSQNHGANIASLGLHFPTDEDGPVREG